MEDVAAAVGENRPAHGEYRPAHGEYRPTHGKYCRGLVNTARTQGIPQIKKKHRQAPNTTVARDGLLNAISGTDTHQSRERTQDQYIFLDSYISLEAKTITKSLSIVYLHKFATTASAF